MASSLICIKWKKQGAEKGYDMLLFVGGEKTSMFINASTSSGIKHKNPNSGYHC